MQQVTIIAENNKVVVDGIGYSVDCTPLTKQGIRIVQWLDNWKHIEYYSTPNDIRLNSSISSFAPYQHYVTAWEASKTADEAAAAVAQAEFEIKRNAILKR